MCTQVAATLYGGIAQFQQGQYAQQLAEQNARNVQSVYYQNELIKRNQAARAIATQKVALASQGGGIDSGTPLLLLSESARNAELDALAIRSEGEMKAAAYKAQGKQAAQEGINALWGAGFTAASQALQSASGSMAGLGAI